nr:uncharacterized protein LOC115495267 [Taeniopygia guttata]
MAHPRGKSQGMIFHGTQPPCLFSLHPSPVGVWMWKSRIPDFGAGPRPTRGWVSVEEGHQNSIIMENGSRSKPSPLFPGPIVRGQLSRQLSRHCSLPGSSWLSLPVPEPSEPEQSPKKPMSSSEPILDLKGDTVEALSENLGGTGEQSSCPPRDTPGSGQALEHTEPAALEEPRQSPGMRQDGDDPGNAAGPPGPGRDAREGTVPSPPKSPPWPEAPEQCPARPSTLSWHSSPRKLLEGQQRGTDRAVVTENGLEATPATATATTTATATATGMDRAVVTENGLEATPATTTATSTATAMATASSEERQALQSELGKCIEEFRRIRIPAAFPNKKRQWQSELLRKYQL